MTNEHQDHGGEQQAHIESGAKLNSDAGDHAPEILASSDACVAEFHAETDQHLAVAVTSEVAVPRASHAGADLAYRRNFLGLTEADIAARLKLSVRRVALLEAGEWQAFGSPTTLRGFVRAYAKTVGLDPDLMVSSLPSSDHSNAQLSLEPTLSQPLGGKPARNGRPFWFSLPLWGALAVCAALVLGWMGRDMFAGKWITALKGNSRPAAPAVATGNTDVSEQPLTLPSLGAASTQTPLDTSAQASAPAPVTAVAPAPLTALVQAPMTSPMTTALPNPSPTPAIAAASTNQDRPSFKAPESSAKPAVPGSVQVKLVFDQQSWVEVTSPNGSVLMSGVVPGGAERLVDAAPGTVVVLGNAPAVKVFRAGKVIDLVPFTTKSVARLTLN
jgi:cytoskeleton protein RodZ